MLSLMSFCDRQGIPEILLRGHNGHTRSDGERSQSRETSDSGVRDEHNNDESTGSDGGSIDGSDSASNSTEQQSGNSDVDRFETDIVTLRNFSFITTNDGGTTFEMHRLVQPTTLQWLRAQDLYEQ